MNERYRYGYGEDFPNRDFPFSRQGAMTDHREDESGRRDADADELAAEDEDEDEDEQAQADRIREAHDATMPFQPVSPEREAPRSEEAGEREGTAASTRSDSVFDVEEHTDRPPAYQPERPAATVERERPPAAREESAPATRSQERPPIALGPPSPPSVEAPAPPPAAPPRPETGTPVPGPAPQADRGGERTSLLASIDRDSIRSRFLDIQAGFVDEPRQAVEEAEGFVDELVQRLVQALDAERAKLKSAIDDGSTEDLRLALRGYRAFVDRLLSLTM